MVSFGKYASLLLGSTIVMIRPPTAENLPLPQKKKSNSADKGNFRLNQPSRRIHPRVDGLVHNKANYTQIPSFVLKSGNFTNFILLLILLLGLENYVLRQLPRLELLGLDMINRLIAYYLPIYWCSFNKNIWQFTVRKMRILLVNINARAYYF